MKISLVTPAGPEARNGNRHTALRWAAFLRAAGHRVKVSIRDTTLDADLLLALHARKSHESIMDFWRHRPSKPIVLALTGTDVYHDIQASAQAQESLERADRLIVLQPRAIEELPARLAAKAHVVVQSSATRLRQNPVKGRFRVCVIGNLRSEKDPLRMAAALPFIAREDLQVVQLGALLDPSQKPDTRDARYRWLGSVPHARALRWLASSHAMVISSRMEGGANVVCEAIRIGVPVLASYIPGNIGLLGEGYPGYFPLEDERSLAALVSKAMEDKRFYKRLAQEVRRLRPMVAPRSEARALLSTL